MTRAGEELHVTPGAISRQIGELERHLDAMLFIRRSSGLVLTAAGEDIAQAASIALDRLAEAASGVKMQRHRRLSLGAYGFFASRILMPIWAEFRQTYPDILVDLHTCTNATELVPGRFDAVILVGDAIPQKGLITRKLLPISTIPICAPSLLDGRAPDFSRLPLLHVRPRPDDWHRWLNHVGLNNVRLEGGSTFESLGIMLRAASAGFGIGLAVEALLGPDLASGEIVIADSRRRPTRRSFVLQYEACMADDPTLSVVANWLCDKVAESARG